MSARKRGATSDRTDVLLPQHRELIEDSAVTADVAAQRGYRSVTTQAEARKLGFTRTQARVPGLLVPIHDVDGIVAFHQLRPDEPRTRKGKAVKYETPKGVRMVIDVPPAVREYLNDPNTDLYVTEGSRKADCAVSRGLCCISLLGVWNWRGTNSNGGKTVLPDWERIALNDRRVFIAFDSDVMTKREVHLALERLNAFLVSRRAHVRFIYLPDGEHGRKVGLDDYFAAGGSVEELSKLASEELRSAVTSRRQILISRGGLLRVLDECELALVEDRDADPIFDLGGRGLLCRIHRLRSRTSYQVETLDRESHTANTSILDDDQVVQRLMGAADFVTETQEGIVPTDCPQKHGRHFARRGSYKLLPPLLGIIQAPTIRPDGSVLQTPGYDDATGFYLDVADGVFSPIPEHPSPADAAAALKLIDDLLGEFCYAFESDRATAIAVILTALVRRSLPIAPGFAFDAPVMSSGKTTHAHVVSVLTTGHRAPTLAWPDTEEERRKTLFAVLLRGDPCVIIDNVEKPLQSAVLCELLTSFEHTDRILGASRQGTVPTTTTWMITGNNLRLVGDMISRIVPCRLDPKEEFPEERKYDRDVLGFAFQNRGELVRAALTILVAYQVSGDRVETSGFRFREWSRIVREPLLWLGLPDPLAGIRKLRSQDLDREKLGQLMEAWSRAVGSAAKTARAVVQSAGSSTDLKDALLEVATDPRSRELSASRLGYFLRRQKGKIVGGRWFTEAGTASGGVNLWTLVTEGVRVARPPDGAADGDDGDEGDDPDRPEKELTDTADVQRESGSAGDIPLIPTIPTPEAAGSGDAPGGTDGDSGVEEFLL